MPFRRVLMLALLVMPLSAAAWAQSAAGAASPFVGRWQWSRAESTMTSDEPMAQEMVMTISAADPRRVAWSITGKDPEGRPYSQAYDGTGDGKPAPVNGLPSGSMAGFTAGPASLDAAYTYPNGASERISCSVSPDRRKMTCRGTENDGRGQSRDYVDVYDRR